MLPQDAIDLRGVCPGRLGDFGARLPGPVSLANLFGRYVQGVPIGQTAARQDFVTGRPNQRPHRFR